MKTGSPCKRIKKLKVLMVERGGWGGLWHYTCCLGNALYEQGVDLRVVTSEGFEEPFELKFKVIPAIRNNRSYCRNVLNIYRIIAGLKPALVHIQSWLSARRDWIPLGVLRAAGMPVVFTAHNLLPHDEVERKAPFMTWAFKKLYMSGSAIIVHSRANKERLNEVLKIPREKITIIPHGNYRFFAQQHCVNRDTARKEFLQGETDKRVFLIFGAMRHYKGIDLALEAISRLPELKGMHLLIAGKPFGTILEDCKELARELGVNSNVMFLPGYFNDEEIAKLHTAADVLLFPYRDIFQSGALQIALAFGKPIIATAVGSFPETLSEKNAWLVEPNSPNSLAAALEKALATVNPALQSMGEESLRIAVQEHDWQEIARKTRTLYLGLSS